MGQVFFDTIGDFHKEINTLKEELKLILINEFETYGDVDKFLCKGEQIARYSNEKFTLLMISELKKDFEKEKNMQYLRQVTIKL